jgi:hypothetical protein
LHKNWFFYLKNLKKNAFFVCKKVFFRALAFKKSRMNDKWMKNGKKFGTLHEFACHPCAGAMLIFSVLFQF